VKTCEKFHLFFFERFVPPSFFFLTLHLLKRSLAYLSKSGDFISLEASLARSCVAFDSYAIVIATRNTSFVETNAFD
jgi:hypothetical protein